MFPKLSLMFLTWFLAFAMSFGLRVWGTHHPAAFNIRPVVITSLLFGPSILLGVWVAFKGFRYVNLENPLDLNQ